MNLHTLTSTPGARRPKRRVGRGMGSGLGKTCGRGHKGQYARTGHKHKPGFEGGQMRLLRRLPKRGFVRTSRHEWVAVNVGSLERFEPGTLVTAEVLRASGLKIGPRTAVKILGGGNLTRKLSVRAQAFSAAAKTKIEACGGSWEVTAR